MYLYLSILQRGSPKLPYLSYSVPAALEISISFYKGGVGWVVPKTNTQRVCMSHIVPQTGGQPGLQKPYNTHTIYLTPYPIAIYASADMNPVGPTHRLNKGILRRKKGVYARISTLPLAFTVKIPSHNIYLSTIYNVRLI